MFGNGFKIKVSDDIQQNKTNLSLRNQFRKSSLIKKDIEGKIHEV